MAKFSKPELQTEATEIVGQIMSGLEKRGVPASLSEHDPFAIKVEGQYYAICFIEEATKKYMHTLPQGYLAVCWAGLFLPHTHNFRASTAKVQKGTVAKVIDGIQERYESIRKDAELAKAKHVEAKAIYQSASKLRKAFPEYTDNISNLREGIQIKFDDLTEDAARAILAALKAAGIEA